jgi:polypeptide N-acetylgalactosaminyltransferase
VLVLVLAGIVLFLFVLSALIFASTSSSSYIMHTFSTTTATSATNLNAAINFAPYSPPRKVEGEVQVYIDNRTPNPTFLCLDNNAATGLYPCHHQEKRDSTQMFFHVQDREITSGNKCMTGSGMDVTLTEYKDGAVCHQFTRDRYGRLIIVSNKKDKDNNNEKKQEPSVAECLVVVSQAIKQHGKPKASQAQHMLGILSCNTKSDASRVVSIRFSFLSPKSSAKRKDNYDFDEDASQVVGMVRKVPDIRHDLCRQQTKASLASLPKTSIIMCFVDEEYYALTRSIISVLSKSPTELVGEIILLDDGSTSPDMLAPLEEFVAQIPNVRIVRTHARIGLIKARALGVSSALYEVVTFLDSHIEVVEGWLEPLMERLAVESEIIVTPQIVVINQDNLRFQQSVSYQSIAYGQLNWDLVFHWAYTNTQPPPGKKRTSPIDPVSSPTMAGGLFSVRKSFFQRVGGYDEKMRGWGGENIEMSIRMWACGHRIELIPCSVVGHIFRQKNPTRFPGTDVTSVLFFNRKRVVETWMDSPYKEIFYATTPKLIHLDVGDLSDRLKMRKRLHCKDFSWYLRHLLPNLFPPTPTNLIDKMRMRIKKQNGGAGRCMNMPNVAAEASIVPCKLKLTTQCNDISSSFYYTSTKQLRGTDWPRIGWCLTSSEGNIVMDTCETRNDMEEKVNEQQWDMLKEDGGAKIKNVAAGLCLAVESDDINSNLPPRWNLKQCAGATLFEIESVGAGRYSGVARIGAFAVGSTNEERSDGNNKHHQSISVVLPCSGEAALMTKTVKSIFEATPQEVLKEVIGRFSCFCSGSSFLFLA